MTNAAILSRFLRQASFWWGVNAYGSRTAELAARKDLAATIACLPEGLPDRYVAVRDAAIGACAQAQAASSTRMNARRRCRVAS